MPLPSPYGQSHLPDVAGERKKSHSHLIHPQVWKDVKATSWPALRSSWRFWPFVHAISFSHAVPLDLKLLWVDVMEIVWVTILSRVANQDDVRIYIHIHIHIYIYM